MLQMMLNKSWLEVADGSSLTQQAAPDLGWGTPGTPAKEAQTVAMDEGTTNVLTALARAAVASASTAAAAQRRESATGEAPAPMMS